MILGFYIFTNAMGIIETVSPIGKFCGLRGSLKVTMNLAI